MENPKTTLAGYATLAATMIALLIPLLPTQWSHYATLLAVALGGGATALGNIHSQDGKP